MVAFHDPVAFWAAAGWRAEADANSAARLTKKRPMYSSRFSQGFAASEPSKLNLYRLLRQLPELTNPPAVKKTNATTGLPGMR